MRRPYPCRSSWESRPAEIRLDNGARDPGAQVLLEQCLEALAYNRMIFSQDDAYDRALAVSRAFGTDLIDDDRIDSDRGELREVRWQVLRGHRVVPRVVAEVDEDPLDRPRAFSAGRSGEGEQAESDCDRAPGDHRHPGNSATRRSPTLQGCAVCPRRVPSLPPACTQSAAAAPRR